jgi:hypothetical protein
VATKGDIQTFSGAPANLAVGADGTILHADSGAGTGLSYSQVDLASEVSGVLPAANGGSSDRLPLAGGTLTGDLRINLATARLWIQDPAGAVDEKKWLFHNTLGIFRLYAVNDAESVSNIALEFNRVGAALGAFRILPDAAFIGAALLSGKVSVSQQVNTALVNGANNDVVLSGKSYVKIKAGPTGAFSITGIAGGTDGRMVLLHNSTGQNMTIANEALSTAANRILTLTGADFVSTGDCFVRLIYDADALRWIVMATQG